MFTRMRKDCKQCLSRENLKHETIIWLKKELHLHEETWRLQQNGFRPNDEMVEYLLNSLSSYKANMV